MKEAIGRGGEFIEHAEVHGNLYGTSNRAVQDVSDKCRVCLLDIDVQGVKSCKAADFKAAKYIFVQPPSIDALRTRLLSRGTESEASLNKRLTNAKGEIDAGAKIDFDARILNDDLDVAYEQFRKEVLPVIEQCRKCRGD